MNEVLKGEPIDLFRLRNGALTRIHSATGDILETTENGSFNIIASKTSGIVLSESGTIIATINERTGKIALDNNTAFQVSATPANKDSPLQIQVLDSEKKVIFTEKMNISQVTNIEQASNFDSLSGTGIFVLPNA